MADGLHAMAQPLTRLESRLFLASEASEAAPQEQSSPHRLVSPPESAVEDPAEVLQGLLADLHALREPFRLMQQIIRLHTSRVHCEPVGSSCFARLFAEVAEAVFSGSGCGFTVEPGGDPAPMQKDQLRLDLPRFREALCSVLHATALLGATAVRCAPAPAGSGPNSARTWALGMHWKDELPLLSERIAAAPELLRLHLAVARAALALQGAAMVVRDEPPAFLITVGCGCAEEQACSEMDTALTPK